MATAPVTLERDASPAEPVALAIPANIALPAWINLGRDLFTRHRNLEWMLADWLRVGIERFHDEPQMDLFLDQIGVDKKRAIADAKVAKLIPASWRSDRVSFEVCKHIAKVEDEDLRLRMLRQAEDEHWNERQAHHAIVEHKVTSGRLWEDGDDVARGATEMVRCWNRASPESREYFFQLAEMGAAKGFGLIDQDMAV